MKAPTRLELEFSSGQETLVGELVAPTTGSGFPTVLFIAGYGPSDRYQRFVMPDGKTINGEPTSWIANALAELGIGVFTWDKRGLGASSGGDRKPGDPPGDRDAHASVLTDVADAREAMKAIARLPNVDESKITIMGHSAGVHFASLLAAEVDLPSNYILWSGVYRNIDDLIDSIYTQVRDFADRGSEEFAFIQEHSPAIYAAAQHQEEILEAARSGKSIYEWEHLGVKYVQHLERLKQELALPLSEQFKNIEAPTLVIHGDEDLNVSVNDAYEIVGALKSSGNVNTTLVVVPGADHGMRVAPRDLSSEVRLRQRLSFYGGHPRSDFFLHAVAGWILDQTKLQADTS